MGMPDVSWGGTDSGGKSRPKVSFSGSYAGVHSDVTLPADGFRGLDEDWPPVSYESTALDARRTKSRRRVGFRGTFTVRYSVLDAGDYQIITRIVNLNDTMWLYPHSDVDRRYEVSIVATSGLTQEIDGRPIAYGPCSITFETVQLYRGKPNSGGQGWHFASHTATYDDGEEIAHFGAHSATYDNDEEVGHFNSSEE